MLHRMRSLSKSRDFMKSEFANGNGILTSSNEASTMTGKSDRKLRSTTATLQHNDNGRNQISVAEVAL